MHQAFSIREALRYGWEKTKAHSALLFQAVIAVFAVQVATSIVERVLGDSTQGGLASFGLGVLGLFIGTGLTLIALKLAKGEPARISLLFPNWRLVWRYLVSSVLVGLIMCAIVLVSVLLLACIAFFMLGAVVLALATKVGPEFLFLVGLPLAVCASVIIAATVVALAYVALRYSMSRFAIVDGAGIRESLRQSTAMTRGVKWHLLLFGLALIAINLLGALLFLVGLLVTIPVSVMAYAHVYLKLKNRA